MVLSDQARTALDALLYAAVERHDIPGVVATVANRERVIYRGAFGKLDEHGAIDMPTDALFQILSMTKPVTSVAIMMLREQELLDLDDSIDQYLPELVGREVLVAFNEADASYTTRPATRAVTVRDLLTHTAGFGYDFSNDTLRVLCRDGERSPRDLPLLHDPGSQWTYGMSTRLLGEVIERISGEPLDAFFEARIFRPLGMRDTGFDLKPQDCGRLVSLFQRVNGELVGEQKVELYERQVFGDYGLLATADDYIRFLQMLLNMGQFDSTRLLSTQSVNELTMNQIGSLKVQKQPGAIPDMSNSFPLGAGEDTFSLGFQLKEGDGENARSHGSYSWAGLFNTHFWADPHLGIAAVLLLQVLPFYDDRCIRLLTEFEHHIYRKLG
jgi:CubicO group peptidase (beta-lactamase class C family)